MAHVASGGVIPKLHALSMQGLQLPAPSALALGSIALAAAALAAGPALADGLVSGPFVPGACLSVDA